MKNTPKTMCDTAHKSGNSGGVPPLKNQIILLWADNIMIVTLAQIQNAHKVDRKYAISIFPF
ncbi:MAG: hypothetical protein FWG05_04115 [Kiritimatiellaeota bacterium]|nr:hypothetical protein [Kiritimatiellota bacterium]